MIFTAAEINAARYWRMMREGRASGRAEGERDGYVRGWRRGVFHGTCGVIAGGLACLVLCSLVPGWLP